MCWILTRLTDITLGVSRFDLVLHVQSSLHIFLHMITFSKSGHSLVLILSSYSTFLFFFTVSIMDAQCGRAVLWRCCHLLVKHWKQNFNMCIILPWSWMLAGHKWCILWKGPRAIRNLAMGCSLDTPALNLCDLYNELTNVNMAKFILNCFRLK